MQKKTKQTPGPYALAVSGPQPVRCHPVCAGPFVETVRRSVTDTMGRHFVGLANYTAVLGNDAFRLAVENTVRFIGVCVPLLLALSLALALALRAKGLKIPPGPRSAAQPFAAHGFAGGKPCTALESIVCPKRPCERNFWHPL